MPLRQAGGLSSSLPDVAEYFSGATLPARDLFESHRSLRALIAQVKQYNSFNHTNRTENTYEQQQQRKSSY
jgi:hypothetical protein